MRLVASAAAGVASREGVGRRLRRLLAVGLVCVAFGCGPRPIRLPGEPGAALSAPDLLLSTVRTRCRGVRTMTAEVAVSGRSAGRRLRGRLLAGVAEPASARLEAVAPFGAPLFVLAARDDLATLLLPREDQVVLDAPARDVVEALTGVALGARDLRALLSGCFTVAETVTGGRAYADGWSGISLADGSTVFVNAGELRLATRGTLTVEYGQFAFGLPRRIRLVSASAPADGPTDLDLVLSQVDTNVPIDPRAFDVAVPETAERIALDQLRGGGPLGAR